MQEMFRDYQTIPMAKGKNDNKTSKFLQNTTQKSKELSNSNPTKNEC